MDWNQIEAKWAEMTRRVQSQPATRSSDRTGRADPGIPAPVLTPRQPEAGIAGPTAE